MSSSTGLKSKAFYSKHGTFISIVDMGPGTEYGKPRFQITASHLKIGITAAFWLCELEMVNFIANASELMARDIEGKLPLLPIEEPTP